MQLAGQSPRCFLFLHAVLEEERQQPDSFTSTYYHHVLAVSGDSPRWVGTIWTARTIPHHTAAAFNKKPSPSDVGETR